MLNWINNFTYVHGAMAIAEREREGMPLIGPCVDRRTLALLGRAYNSSSVQSLMCFVCDQIKTHLRCQEGKQSDIQYYPGKLFVDLHEKSPEMFSLNCSLAKFVARYAQGTQSQGNPFTNAPELAEGSSEWQRQLTFLAADKAPIRMLGNPEHVRGVRPLLQRGR